MDSFNSAAAIYREIDRSQKLFKYNKSRLTLRDAGSKPFKKMSQPDIEKFLTAMISQAGFFVREIKRPGEVGSRSSKFSTFIVCENLASQSFPIVFGYAFSEAEEIQITEISRSISSLINEAGAVRMWNGREYVNVNGVIRKGGSREKADAVACFNGSPKISISLKHLKSGLASQMQGWSGVSHLQDHPEIISFADSIKSSGLFRSWRKLSDLKLKKDACWGCDGDQVDIIAAGSKMCLVYDGLGHRLEAGITGGIWYASNDEIPAGDFEPVLFCRPSSEHSIMTSCGPLRGFRMMIAPAAGACVGSASKEI